MAKSKAVDVKKEVRISNQPSEKDFSVIIEPILTEKSMQLMEKENKITVRVNVRSNATEIKKAFEAIFNVKVEKVNTANVRAHSKRVGRFVGVVGAYKKAIVKLAEGQALDLFKKQA